MHVGAGVTPLHVAGGASLPLEVVVAVVGVGSLVLVAAGFVAYRRRRRWSHLLVVGALATLFARAAVAALSMGGVVDAGVHHVAEHALDLLSVTLVFGAVLYARRVEDAASEVNRSE
ncbi:MAG: hypothetical protein ABEJ82_02245 [Haloplanus sp.]